MDDIMAIAVLLIIIGAAVAYVIKAKKSGKKCIGCPNADFCAEKCGGCSYKGGEETDA